MALWGGGDTTPLESYDPLSDELYLAYPFGYIENPFVHEDAYAAATPCVEILLVPKQEMITITLTLGYEWDSTAVWNGSRVPPNPGQSSTELERQEIDWLLSHSMAEPYTGPKPRSKDAAYYEAMTEAVAALAALVKSVESGIEDKRSGGTIETPAVPKSAASGS